MTSAKIRWIRPIEGAAAVLLPGAFDPPTNAHLAILASAARWADTPGAFCVSTVLLDRPSDALLTDAARLELLDAIAADAGFGLLTVDGGTYLEMARAARAAGLDARFAIGSDKLAQIADPSFYSDGSDGVTATFAEVRFVVVERRGFPIRRTGLDVIDAFTDEETASISATDVRRLVRSGADVASLVPARVTARLQGYTEPAEPR